MKTRKQRIAKENRYRKNKKEMPKIDGKKIKIKFIKSTLHTRKRKAAKDFQYKKKNNGFDIMS